MSRYPAILIAMMAFSACGDSKKAKPSTGDDITPHQDVVAKAGAVASTSAPLPTTPIDLSVALGTPAKVTAPGPCPFVSDATAIATAVARTNQPLSRKRVSNTECVWNYDLGASVTITIAPIDTAIPLSERRYNIGTDPTLEKQEGPGENAAILMDTTWGKPRPYAFGFETEGRSILISVVGLATDPERLRATANDVAKTLPSAPSIEPQQMQSESSFDACKVWEPATLLALFGYSAESVVSPQGSKAYCTYTLFGKPGHDKVTIGLSFLRSEESQLNWYKEKGHEVVSGYDLPVLKNVSSDSFGTNIELRAFAGNDTITVTVSSDKGAMLEPTTALMNNLIARLGRP